MYVNAPHIYPTIASSDILFTYQKKGIFSSPIIATPAAEPIIKQLPPVPAQSVSYTHLTLPTKA